MVEERQLQQRDCHARPPAPHTQSTRLSCQASEDYALEGWTCTNEF